MSQAARKPRAKSHLRIPLSVTKLNSSLPLGLNYATTIGVGENLQPKDILKWVNEFGFHHIVQENSLEFDRELKTSVVMTQRPDLFLALPLASILSPEQPKVENERKFLISTMDIKNFSLRDELLARTEQHIKGLIKQKRQVHDILLIADEMLNYALFNAAHGELRPTTDYSEEEERDDLADKPCTLFIGADETRIVLGVRDPHGTIEAKALISNLNEYYNRDFGVSVRTAEDSASTEAFQMINSSASFYAGFRPGQAAVICCAVPVGLSQKSRDHLPKNFHYFCETF